MKTNTDAVLSAKSLRYFLQLIDNMSYTQAAQILGITQPALTQQIKKTWTSSWVTIIWPNGQKIIFNWCWPKDGRDSFSRVNNAVDSIQQYTKSDTGTISLEILSTI